MPDNPTTPPSPRHVIECREAGWTIKHPLSCRPALFDCPVNRAAEDGLFTGHPAPGRYYVELVDAMLRVGEPVPDRPVDTGRPFIDLRPTGLLWLINRVVFHPRGYALALVLDEHGDAAGWQLQGDGTEVWHFKDPGREDQHFAEVAATFAAAAAGAGEATDPAQERHLAR